MRLPSQSVLTLVKSRTITDCARRLVPRTVCRVLVLLQFGDERRAESGLMPASGNLYRCTRVAGGWQCAAQDGGAGGVARHRPWVETAVVADMSLLPAWD
jgi:hypothetical protein